MLKNNYLKIKIFLILIFLFSPLFCDALVYIEEPIYEDTIFTSNEGPYVIDSLVILDGANVVIEENTELYIGNITVVNGSLLVLGGVDIKISGGITIYSDGDFDILGTSILPVNISAGSYDPEIEVLSWGGINFIGSADSTISYLNTSCISSEIYGENVNVNFNNINISGLDGGIVFTESVLNFEHIILENINDGFLFDNSNVSISDIVVDNISEDLFLFFGDSFGGVHDFEISNASSAIFSFFENSDFDISSGIIHDASGSFFEIYDESIVDILDVSMYDGGYYGIWIFEDTNVSIENVVLDGVFETAIEIFGNADVSILDSQFLNGLGQGLGVYNQAEVLLSDILISGFLLDGIFMAQNAHLEITDSVISENGGSGLFVVNNSNLNIENSSILNNGEYGLVHYGENELDVRNNWWGDPSGPEHLVLEGGEIVSQNPLGLGDSVLWTDATVLFSPWLLSYEENLDPLIIIPGIMGSWQKDGEWLIDPILGVYDDIIATFDNNEYDLGINLFPFPYEWRDSNVDTAILLKQKIDEVKEICECNKVDVVAHSMGGLIARQYVQSDDYEDDIDQLIFLGTPHLGSPEAYITWGGGRFLREKSNYLKMLALQFIFDYQSLKNQFGLTLHEYIHERPISSLNELLPVYPFLYNGEVLKDFETEHPQNEFLQNLTNTIDNLLNSGVRISNIIANNELDDTIVGIKVRDFNTSIQNLWPNGIPQNFGNILTNQGMVRGVGDGTVPNSSSSFVSEGLLEVNSNHQDMVDDTQEIVYELLTGVMPDGVVKTDNNINVGFILFSVFSPVDIQIEDPNGNISGLDFENDGEISEFSNYFYSGNDTDLEFLIIFDPIPGEYKIHTKGTGGGEYRIVSTYVTEENISEIEHDSVARNNQVESFGIKLSNQTGEIIFPRDGGVVIGSIPLREDNLLLGQLNTEIFNLLKNLYFLIDNNYYLYNDDIIKHILNSLDLISNYLKYYEEY